MSKCKTLPNEIVSSMLTQMKFQIRLEDYLEFIEDLNEIIDGKGFDDFPVVVNIREKWEDRRDNLNLKTESILDVDTIQLLKKVMKLRKERSNPDDDLSMNQILRFVIEREIQIIKDDFPTEEDLRERNLKRGKRLQEQKVNPIFYCPQMHMDIQNIMICHISCPYGHMLECHYPYYHNSEYCHHYDNERDFENQIELQNLDEDPGTIS